MTASGLSAPPRSARVAACLLLASGVGTKSRGFAGFPHDEQWLNGGARRLEIHGADVRYVASLLHRTLESPKQWGSVRVVPDTGACVDVVVSGR
jgi:hypothetical protein